MNDLVEKGLRGLDVAYRAGRTHVVPVVGVVGFAVSTVIVIAGGRVGAARATRPLTTWLGIQGTHGAQADDLGPGVVLFAAVAALVLLWVATVELVRRRTVSEAGMWAVVGAWAMPLAIGPPLFDTSVYSYTAFGFIQRAGHDPYTSSANTLGLGPVLEAIDPGSRGVSSSSGPLGTAVQHLAVSVAAGNALAAVIVLRVLAVVSMIWIGRLAADMGGRRRSRAISLTALNPLVLLFVVSGAHLEGLVAGLVLKAIMAANRRRWTAAIVWAGIAGSVLAPAFVVVAAIVAVHVVGRRHVRLATVLARDTGVAAVTIGAFGIVVHDGFGWARTASDQFAAHTPYSIAEATGKLLTPIVRGASYDDLTGSCRLAAAIAMVAVIVYLLVTAGGRALERTAGYALLAVGLLAPALYPWYLIGGVVAIAASANAVRKIWVLGLSAAGCALMPGGFASLTGDVVTGCALTVVAVATAVGLRAATTSGDIEEIDPVSAAG